MCAPSLSLSVPAAGGDGLSYLGEGCYWATGFAVDVGWIHVTGTHGGGLYLEYRMEMNTGSSRTGHITMSGHGLDMQITINQSGAIP